jgi:hypothetical protein
VNEKASNISPEKIRVMKKKINKDKIQAQIKSQTGES